MAMTTREPLLGAIALVLLGGLVLGAAGQGAPPRQSPPPLTLRSTYGADLYQFYCSGCHGVTAQGGPARTAQHPPAPDLTVLARRNNGIFPRDRVRATITFGPTATVNGAHGTADMPVWGTVFRGLDTSHTMTEIRIENVVQYLISLQETDEGQHQH
jgi:mono/diheme cytochrome c family protein